AGVGRAEPELVPDRYFDMLGVRVIGGRRFIARDVESGAAPVAVVSESMWANIAGPGVPFEGRSVLINNQPFAVVGVADRSFRGIQIGRNVRVWVPVSQQPAISPNGGQSYWD